MKKILFVFLLLIATKVKAITFYTDYNELSESAKYIHELDNHYKVNYALICDDFTYLDYESRDCK